MTHLDNTTITPNGQGSNGHDKSNAAPSPYTHFPATSTLAGLLDGLVADAHVELGTEPSELDRFLDGLVADAAAELAADRYGSNGPVHHTNPAIHGPIDDDLVQRVLSLDEPEPTDFRPTDHENPYRAFNSRTEVRRHLGEIEYQRCPEYAKFRRIDYDGDTTVKGRGCGVAGCPACRHNRQLRDRGKPYAAGVGDLITDITITGRAAMAIGKGSPWANLRNAHREICSLGAVAMLGQGFTQRIVIDGILDDLGKHVEYLRGQVGVAQVTVTIGEPPTFAALHEWMAEPEEWHYRKQRWRFHGWGVKKPPKLRGPYSDDIENATEEEETGDTPAVAQLKAEVRASPHGPERNAAVKVAELTIVQGYINRGASLPKVWIRALTDAAGRLTCVGGTCQCAITDRGRKRHRDAAKKRWTPAMYAVAEYVGDERFTQLANMALR